MFLSPAGVFELVGINQLYCLTKRRKQRMRRKSVSIYTAHSSSVVSRSYYFYLSHVSNYASTSYDHHINLEKSKGYIGTTVAPFGSPTNSFSFYKLIHYGTILSAKKESLSCILQVIFLFLNCNLLYI